MGTGVCAQSIEMVGHRSAERAHNLRSANWIVPGEKRAGNSQSYEAVLAASRARC